MSSASRVSLSRSELSSAASSAQAGQRSSPAAPAGGPTAGGEGPWQVAEGSRQRRRRLRQSLTRPACQLTAARPPPHRRLPPGMEGKCYNCLGDDCIVAQCTNMVRCLLCGEAGHISYGCKRPRLPSPPGQAEEGGAGRPPPARSRSPVWLPPPPPGPPPPGTARPGAPAPAPVRLPPPPPPGAVRMERLWSRVVREGSAKSSTRGPAFDVPFMQGAATVVAERVQDAVVEREAPPCFLEFSEEMVHMEEQLRRAVVVTITGTRPALGLEDAAALYAEFALGPEDMSIRAFAPEDFLVLCRDWQTRDRMVARGRVLAPRFSLSLRDGSARLKLRRSRCNT
ncbi:hypothetical protein ACQ4PT_041310 [Festuca glaucescens]